MKRKMLVFVGLLAALIISMPGAVRAQSISINTGAIASGLAQTIATNITNCDAASNSNARESMQERVAAAAAVFSNVPQIDAAMYRCIQAYETVKDLVDDARDAADSGAQNPLITILKAAFKSIAIQLASQIIGQVCNTVMGDLQSLENFAFSQINRLCVPLPNLNLSLGGLHLPMAQCHGVNLAGPILGAVTGLPFPGSGAGRFNLFNFQAR